MNITVIGAGIVGLTTAWYLQRDGHRVTVVDRREYVGQLSYRYVGRWPIRRFSPGFPAGYCSATPRCASSPASIPTSGSGSCAFFRPATAATSCARSPRCCRSRSTASGSSTTWWIKTDSNSTTVRTANSSSIASAGASRPRAHCSRSTASFRSSSRPSIATPASRWNHRCCESPSASREVSIPPAKKRATVTSCARNSPKGWPGVHRRYASDWAKRQAASRWPAAASARSSPAAARSAAMPV
ncbi:MAG: FAD-dependent oxidoreductase [Zoogloeaceae bacterium]|nr:FAD-dependent oxidoreductase [Zoogloeaceae bacterium]